MTTNNIIAKLGGTKSSGVALGACAYLALVQNNETFSRQEILTTMSSATDYYKEAMSSNSSSTLKSLVRKNEIMERRTNSYVLQPKERQSIVAKLNAN